MSSAKKILQKLDGIDSKLNDILARLTKLESQKIHSKKVALKSAPVVKVGKVLITEYGDHILITGDTFDIRNDFKIYRGKWDGDSKGWKIMNSAIDDYAGFKEELETKCSKLQILVGKSGKTKSTTKSTGKSSPTSGLGPDDHDSCMIMDSSDSDSE